MYEKETMRWYGYSLDNGEPLWGPVGDSTAYDYYGYLTNYGLDTAYGRLYVCSYGGQLLCIDLKTGTMLWKYNNTNSGINTPWGNFPLVLGAIADGKVYVFTSEHSPNVPPYKGARVRCIDAYTGKELWTVMGWGSVGTGSSGSFAVADGNLVYLNTYDQQLYCFGRGPSATTVEAPLTSITKGQSLIIKGTVTDQSEGAKGKPAVSDEWMGPWMEYLYMQKPKPTNAAGVQVKLTTVDPNNNTIDIANVTSDTSGMFYYKWTPQLEGAYKVIATFEGSESYWPSYAETAIGVDAASPVSPTAAPTPTPTATPTATPTPTPAVTPSPVPEPKGFPTTEMYIAIAAAVIIIAVAAVAVILRRRK
jgi:hypothetical protein